MNPYIEIIRPGNAIMAVIAVILVAIVGDYYHLPILFSMLAVFFALSGGNVINDYFDYNIDLINCPNRPIPSGRISLKNGRNYAYILFICAIICGGISSYLLNNIIPVLIVIISSSILYIYASTFKSTPLIGNLIVGFMTGLCFIFGGYCTNNPLTIKISYLLGLFAFLMTTAREITKDMEDIEGDLKEGAKTFPIKYGLKSSSILTAIFIIIPCCLTPILYINHIFNIIYLGIIILDVILFLYGAILILRNQNKEICHKVSKLIKIGMLIAFIAFAIGSF